MKDRVLPERYVFASRGDMRSVYAKCRILLAPSVWEEAYGRVVTEAQISGIPVVGVIARRASRSRRSRRYPARSRAADRRMGRCHSKTLEG